MEVVGREVVGRENYTCSLKLKTIFFTKKFSPLDVNKMSIQFYNAFITSSEKIKNTSGIRKNILNYDDLICYIEKFDESKSKYRYIYNNMMYQFIKDLKRSDETLSYILKLLLICLIQKRPIKELSDSFLSINFSFYDNPTTIYVEHLIYLTPKYENFRNTFKYISDDDWNKYVFPYIKEYGFY